MPPKNTNKVKESKPKNKLDKLKSNKVDKVKDTNLTTDDLDYTVDGQDDQPDEQDDEVETVVPELSTIDVGYQPKESFKYKPELRLEHVIVASDNRITSECMTSFEYTEVISHRAKQIENGGICFTDVGDITNPLEMAKLEILHKKCPLAIKRAITDKVFEIWAVNEMAVPYY